MCYVFEAAKKVFLFGENLKSCMHEKRKAIFIFQISQKQKFSWKTLLNLKGIN